MRRLVTAAALLVTGLLLLLSVATPGTALAKTTLAEIEDEVMCPVCGTLLGLAEAPQAERQRVLIRRLIAEGRDKEEIKEILVAEYGPQVLALPASVTALPVVHSVPIAVRPRTVISPVSRPEELFRPPIC